MVMIEPIKSCLVLILLGMFSKNLQSLRLTRQSQTRRQSDVFIQGTSESISSVAMDPQIAIVGYSGSAAEVTAYKLTQCGYQVNMLLDDTPVSPLLQKGRPTRPASPPTFIQT